MRASLLTAVLAVALAGSLAQASIVSYYCGDDEDGVIQMSWGTTPWQQVEDEEPGVATYKMNLVCAQNGVYGDKGHLEGDFVTDTETDPIVYIIEDVENYTNFTWTDYHITVGMDKPFQIIGVVKPADWTSTPVAYPINSAPGSLPSHNNPGTGEIAAVDFFAGTPIAPGQSGTFGVIVKFVGSVSFYTEQYPTPEPATMLLLGIGGLLLRRTRK